MMSQPIWLIQVDWLKVENRVDFGCDNIHSGPICCEQAGTLQLLLDQLHNNNTELHGVGGVVQVIM